MVGPANVGKPSIDMHRPTQVNTLTTLASLYTHVLCKESNPKMPTLYSRNVTTQVSVADLKKKMTAVSFTEEADSVKQVFETESVTLWESMIPSREDGKEMQFLGDYQSIPFRTAHAGKEFFNIQTGNERTLRPLRIRHGFEVKVRT